VRPYARPVLLVVLAASCAAAARDPIAGEPSHHVEGGFRNIDPTVQRASGAARFKFMWSRAWAPARESHVPRQPNDGAALRANHTEPTVTWIGHATVLLQLQGVNLLTDPHWSGRASPLSWAGPKRLQEPGLAFSDLPPIHVVLISHDHYDHLDVATVKRLHAVHDPVFVVPLGLKAWLQGEGISRVVELDWWGAVEQGGLRIVCTPAQHFSQRSFWDSNTRLWASWAVLGTERRFYFSGDTGYFAGFREIGEKLGPFDLTAMAIGAYMPPAIMRYIHLTPEQAVQAHEDLHGKQLVGIHWGTFDLAEEPLDEPPARMLAEASRRGYAPDRAVIPALGETRRW
jgi:N-acyl-phosphatidylethanolamine-hydrolysing phospholipase D